MLDGERLFCLEISDVDRYQSSGILLTSNLQKERWIQRHQNLLVIHQLTFPIIIIPVPHHHQCVFVGPPAVWSRSPINRDGLPAGATILYTDHKRLCEVEQYLVILYLEAPGVPTAGTTSSRTPVVPNSRQKGWLWILQKSSLFFAILGLMTSSWRISHHLHSS